MKERIAIFVSDNIYFLKPKISFKLYTILCDLLLILFIHYFSYSCIANSRKQRKLGKCADGKQFVNPSFVQMLVNMGYNKEAARSALRMCNNIISDSIQYIQENPGPSGTRSQEVISLINDLIPEVSRINHFDQY